MRVYVPIAVEDLGHCLSGTWEPRSGYALTPTLLDISASDDDELLAEQVRDAAAADAVLELGASRRAVVAVDYPRADVQQVVGEHPAAVTLTGRVRADAVACAFVDEPEAEVDGREAAKGDRDALARLEERDLLWYDVSEIGDLATS
ncbi:DUF6912 family protein [Demequina aestuarii]|uniref:DUF6912 family protein n=1 Tax=Demequina aestuarii TaxID=327095 RepID=UPI0007845934|nr:hypothetical protein [Demequina aestuarii]